MIGKTIVYYKIAEKLGEARPSWLGYQAETGLDRKKRVIMMNDLTGRTILHYKIVEQVGQGGPVRRSLHYNLK